MLVENDARKAIQNEQYAVRIPRLATYTPFDIEVLGIPEIIKDGDVYTDNQEALVVVGLSIMDIAEKIDDGYPVTLVNNSDLKPIFKAIEEFLNTTGDNTITIHGGDVTDRETEILTVFYNNIAELNDHEQLKEISKVEKFFEEQNTFGFGEAMAPRGSGYTPNASVSFNDLIKRRNMK